MSDTDQHVRRLFADATNDVPPGIDLLHGFKARRAAGHVRGRVALAAAAACVTAASAVMLTVMPAPSALAQLTSAVTRTAGLSYHFSATTTSVPLQPNGSAPAQQAHSVSQAFNGAFDPALRVGEETNGRGGQFRFIGGYVYYLPIGSPTTPRSGKSWVKALSPPLWVPVTANHQLRIPAGMLSVAETSPQGLFEMLESASTVARTGSVSAPGWTGTSYAFSVSIALGRLGGSPQRTATAIGTVDVDQQGRVRHLAAAFTLLGIASGPPKRVTVEMTFSDFGARVSVSAPPASEVLPSAQIQPGPAN
jgi:hypothetical protein